MSIQDEPLEAGVWLVTVSGRLDQKQSNELEVRLSQLLEEGHVQLVVDLAQVTYVNSGGLRCLVTIWRQARKQGGNVALCSLSERICRVFEVVGFDKVFEIYSDSDSAQRALQEGS